MKAQATVHGAVSLVNAITTGRGATLGIDLEVRATVEITRGSGISIQSNAKSLSSRLIHKTVKKTIPSGMHEKNLVHVKLESEIPMGYGLKSSSAISSCISLACMKLSREKYTDQQVLLAGVDASIESRVSITGAYDDACACYYGGFAVTDNVRRKLIHSERGPKNLQAVIFIPKLRKRGNIKKLKPLRPVFEKAWELARDSDYWTAMTLNGLAASAVLGSNPEDIADLMGRGALGASVSGNGPAIAAIAKKEHVGRIKKAFSSVEGRIIVSSVSNKKAEVHEL